MITTEKRTQLLDAIDDLLQASTAIEINGDNVEWLVREVNDLTMSDDWKKIKELIMRCSVYTIEAANAANRALRIIKEIRP